MKEEEEPKFPPHQITTTANGITGHLKKFCDECQKRQRAFNQELVDEFVNRKKEIKR